MKGRGGRAAAVLGISLALHGCAIYGTSSNRAVVKECVLPSDQAATLSGRWRVLPVPVAFQNASNFDSQEVNEIVAAAKTWNEFFAASLGIKVIDYGDDASPRVSNAPLPSSSSLCGTGLIQGTQFTGNVVIYKRGKWPYTNMPNVMALTSFCPLPGKPFPSLYNAILELNYQNFFVEGRKLPDLQTIVTHEMGHLLGLNHSCDPNAGKAGFISCNSGNLNPEYAIANMFPTFRFIDNFYGEEKRTLEANDQGRANCLYQDAKAK